MARWTAIRWTIPAATFLLAGPALAHEREFTLSRDWFLPYQGESEIESRTFVDTTHGEWLQEFEYEYGVTDWFAVEPGVEIAEKPDSSEIEVEAVDLELRFHFMQFEYGKILPALNVEYEHPSESEEPDRGELKFILSMYNKDGQDISVNFNAGRELEKEKESESELTYGYVRPLREVDASETAYFRSEPRFGVEGIHDFHEGFDRLGPLVIYRPMTHLNLLASYTFALDDRGENFDEFRFIAEWEF
jgi:hypothetical protein